MKLIQHSPRRKKTRLVNLCKQQRCILRLTIVPNSLMFWYLNFAYGKEALANVIFENHFEFGRRHSIVGLKIVGVVIPFELAAECDPNVINVQNLLNYRLFSGR